MKVTSSKISAKVYRAKSHVVNSSRRITKHDLELGHVSHFVEAFHLQMGIDGRDYTLSLTRAEAEMLARDLAKALDDTRARHLARA